MYFKAVVLFLLLSMLTYGEDAPSDIIIKKYKSGQKLYTCVHSKTIIRSQEDANSGKNPYHGTGNVLIYDDVGRLVFYGSYINDVKNGWTIYFMDDNQPGEICSWMNGVLIAPSFEIIRNNDGTCRPNLVDPERLKSQSEDARKKGLPRY